MKTGAQCPISGVLVDNNCMRMTALSIMLLMILFLLTHNPWILLYLFLDYTVRVAKLCMSPLTVLSKSVLRVFKVTPRLVDAQPKLFASRIGFFCVAIVLAGQVFCLPSLSYAMALVLIFCTFMDAVLNFCMGCEIYSRIRR